MNGPNWLMIMNYSLVLVVVVAWFGLFVSVGWELTERRARKAQEMGGADEKWSLKLRDDSHRMRIPELGLTMADGGENVKPSDHNPSDPKPERR